MEKQDNTIRRRLTTSYITSIVSITLVLCLLGIAGILILNSRKLATYVKENIGISVYLSDDAPEVDVFSLQKTLDAKSYVKETRYITREKAAEEFQKELGEDFVEFLGYNPLPSSIDVKLHASYANPDSFAVLEKEFRTYPLVADVAYQKDLVYAINENIRKISMVILGFSIILFIIAITLINNTIRLTVYAKRFIIRTMQLVGAQNSLIRKPFIIKGITQGFIAALLSILILLGIIYITEKQVGDLFSFLDVNILGMVFGTILVTGFLIAWISTLFSVNKYLKIKTDYLYT
ncbi:MAG TPA: permease-like cell division protein FtsX [Bacteroidales bacterium]|jgi:cell division transport system permease protein|nr:permease-like cell division protein FtsX [Bacteroidales bacterium]